MVTQVVLDILSGSQKLTRRDECGQGHAWSRGGWVASIGGRYIREEGGSSQNAL